MLSKILVKIKVFWQDWRDDILWGIIIFLIVILAFGIGFILGSRFYEDCDIKISCPTELLSQ
ncbi:MAG: hypothetical protein ACK4NX_01250 [Candidatus Paceibacteria bacterium]